MKPAFYALRPGGWRDYATLLHPPYTLWHLSYVAVGAALAPHMKWGLLGWTVLAFLLAMGVGAHALDELHGRPLGTRIPSGVLVALAAVSLAAASAIGIVVAADTTWWLLAFVVFGAFVAVAYNLELAGGAFHSDVWFALAWGSFPALTAYFASARAAARSNRSDAAPARAQTVRPAASSPRSRSCFSAKRTQPATAAPARAAVTSWSVARPTSRKAAAARAAAATTTATAKTMSNTVVSTGSWYEVRRRGQGAAPPRASAAPRRAAAAPARGRARGDRRPP